MAATLHSSLPWLLAGALIGSLATLLLLEKKKNRRLLGGGDDDGDGGNGGSRSGGVNLCPLLQDRRRRLPSLIVLLRHGESESNADHTLWRNKPDNLIGLSPRGVEEARLAGERIERLFLDEDEEDEEEDSSATGGGGAVAAVSRVHIHVSPFERTLQTAAAARPAFEHRVVRTSPEPRLREQEFGNVSEKDSASAREEQQRVGRFWYRFPTGESGADVYDRVKSWWCESVLTVNERVGYDKVDAVVVVTHGLTLRFVLMQLYNWSPQTFHSVWNAGNCDMYVLRRDLTKPGVSPYVLDFSAGDFPRSSVNLLVKRREGQQGQRSRVAGGASSIQTIREEQEEEQEEEQGQEQPHDEQVYRLDDYLGIPPPRTTQLDVIKQRLVTQYPDDFSSTDDIASVSFLPFVEGGAVEELADEHEFHHHHHQDRSAAHGPSEDGDDEDDGSNDSCSCIDSSSSSGIIGSGEIKNRDGAKKGGCTPNHQEKSPLEGRLAMMGLLDDDDHAKPEMSFRWPCKY